MALSSYGDALMSGLLARLRPAPRKVGLLRASRLGDFVCATPAFRSLRRALPDAEIVLAALPAMAPLVARLPHLDRIIPFPGAPGIAEQLFDPAQMDRSYSLGQAEKFDLVIQMHGSGVFSNPIALGLGGRVTAGFVRPGEAPGGLDAGLPFPAGLHEVQKLLELCRFLGAESAGEKLEFPIWVEDAGAADELLAPAEPPLIGVHAGAEAVTKRWDPRRFARAAARLSTSLGGTVVLLGAEAGGTDDPLQSESAGAKVVDLRSRTSIPVLGAVISRLAVLLTNDSGPAHIAYATRTASVTIFGGTSPSEWGPGDRCRHRVLAHPVECRPCDFQTCPIGYECLRRITVEEVVQAAELALKSTRQDRKEYEQP
jgi:ADP-heptose:LPS heptosyltransferase